MSVGDAAASSSLRLVTLQEIKEAHARILPHIHRTPLLTSTTIDEIATKRISNKLGNDSKIRIRLAFKSEHLQVIGAFKIRGATNAVKTHLKRLQEEALSQQGEGKDKFNPCKLCIVTHSSGNHAAAVACAAKNVGAKAAVVMPRTAPRTKKEAVAGYGARIVECEPTLEARENAAQALKDEIENDGSGTVVRFIHPYDEELVIAGQGTMGLEIVEQAYELQQGRRSCSAASNGIRDSDPKAWSKRSSEEPPLDFVVAPVGGGGMLSGVSTAIRSLDDRITMIGAEPKEADDAARSLQSGKLQPAIVPPRTICDGLLTALSPRTMMHIQHYVETIYTASESSILSALRLVCERMKQIIEPSAAVGLAVVLDNDDFAEMVGKRAEEIRRKTGKEEVEIRMGVVWTGGNVELQAIAAALEGQRDRHHT